MVTLKSASRSTAFEQWLGAARAPAPAAAAGTSPMETMLPGSAAAGQGSASPQDEMAATLAEVAEYLARTGSGGGSTGGVTDPASLAADSSRYRCAVGRAAAPPCVAGAAGDFPTC